jgi:hypothetical protein
LTAAKLDPSMEYPDQFKQMTTWRCMENKVYACNFGANIPCDSKANTDKTPTQAITDYCKTNPDVDFIPMAVTGHNVIYNWSCVKGMPQIGTALDTVDAAGYQSSFWVRTVKLKRRMSLRSCWRDIPSLQGDWNHVIGRRPGSQMAAAPSLG